MLKEIKKEFNKLINSGVDMKNDNVQTESATQLAEQLNASQVSLTAQVEAFAALNKQYEELTASYTELQAQLKEVETFKEKLVADAAKAKMDARQSKIVASVGTEKAPALLAATQGLDDAAFEAIVGAIGTSMETEASSPLFTETGVEAEAEAVAEVDPVKKLADSLAAKFKSK